MVIQLGYRDSIYFIVFGRRDIKIRKTLYVLPFLGNLSLWNFRGVWRRRSFMWNEFIGSFRIVGSRDMHWNCRFDLMFCKPKMGNGKVTWMRAYGWDWIRRTSSEVYRKKPSIRNVIKVRWKCGITLSVYQLWNRNWAINLEYHPCYKDPRLGFFIMFLCTWHCSTWDQLGRSGNASYSYGHDDENKRMCDQRSRDPPA